MIVFTWGDNAPSRCAQCGKRIGFGDLAGYRQDDPANAYCGRCLGNDPSPAQLSLFEVVA